MQSFSHCPLRFVFRKSTSFKLLHKYARPLSTLELPPGKVAEKQPLIKFQIPKGIMGQPTCHSHPHLIQENCLTNCISQAEYKERRDTFVSKLLTQVENNFTNHIIVMPAAQKLFMSDKIPYVFRQNSDFFYLTGCLEPSAILVIIKPAQTEDYKSILFVHDKDNHAELWDGTRTGCTNAQKLFAVDESLPVTHFENFLERTIFSSKPSTLWYHNESPANPELHSSIISNLKQDNHISLADPQKVLHQMRSIKSASEVQLMKDTCYIGAQSLNMAIACTKPGVCESTINAVLDYSSRQGGAEHLAFPPVVAGGARACHIHYVQNNQLLASGEMLLVDSGCQRWLYNSDLSRTWPVSGKFTSHQKILYELVLTVQKRLIEILGEHRLPLDQLFESMCRLLGKHLQEECILPKTLDGYDLRLAAYRLCPHHVSHYLGLDVHDTPLVTRSVPVETNMVVTVEPGIYIRSDDTSVPVEFRGMGIRIEDDVLITDDKPLVLTESCKKELNDIEELVGKYNISS